MPNRDLVSIKTKNDPVKLKRVDNPEPALKPDPDRFLDEMPTHKIAHGVHAAPGLVEKDYWIEQYNNRMGISPGCREYPEWFF